MDKLGNLSRRKFLYGSALAAGGVALSACSSSNGSNSSSSPSSDSGTGKGSAKKPLAAPKKLTESPTLAAQVKSGKLPALEKRLPENPYVVPHNWVKRGKYGGTLQLSVFTAQGVAGADSNREYFYGHSPMRWLNDGLDIGPGIAETWSSNADTSEWTINFRKGLKWSDGEPFTVDDVLFWWEDIVLPGHYAQVPPDDCRSGKGTLVKMSKVDDTTLKMTYDAPAPLTAEHMAAYVKGAIGKNGPIWVLPKHYLKAFHPKYNPKVPKSWDTIGGLWESKSDWLRNPECPTLIGYTCKSFNNNQGMVLQRNPYYYAVTKDGDQLPYIDEINYNFVQDAQVAQLQVQQGKVDFTQGGWMQIGLDNVSTLKQSQQKSKMKVLLWGTGSGTGGAGFLNYDYPDKKLRTLFREPKFRQALSHAFNRATLRKAQFFNTGEVTTGTISQGSLEFNVGSQGKQSFKDWRDSYSKYDPAKAKSLLAELGLKDSDGDGYVEMPGGGKLTLRIDYSADQSKDSQAIDDQLVADCKAVGLHMTRNPIPPQNYSDQWEAGKLMIHTNWDVSNVGSILVQPYWLVPIENQRWAPLEGEFYAVRGTAKEHEEKNVDPWKRNPARLEPDPSGPIAKMWKFYDQAKLEPDQMKRTQLVWQIIKIHTQDGPFFWGVVNDPPSVTVVKTDLNNVPGPDNLAQGGLSGPWGHPTPAVYDPETFFWAEPSQHTA
ncbi:MAG TPA: ABC transporter substrate-binding protein [Mycobacteriales bacterium]|jgi:peptide/nickel transport system substrate-binding protein|nr:ABC transporter substrate-binding protein [Mycobacteriales bacterium]